MNQLGFVILATLFCGCTNTRQTMVNYDESTGVRTEMVRNNIIGEMLDPLLKVAPARMTGRDGTSALWLVVEYESDSPIAGGWILIKPGPSLIFMLDEKIVQFTGEGSVSNRQQMADGVRERAFYPVTADQLREISRATIVKVRVLGSRGYLDKDFTRQNKKVFEEFVKKGG